MLRLTNITKTYPSGDVTALQGVSIAFRPNEFVSILGPSGCGKTTLLNIIGGRDRYSSGELSVRGVPTTDFCDHDWDTYRNHSIGFVFQSYNLIPHQTVLANVELALTLSGVSRAERRRRAIDALEAVGLGDQLRKKPSQMSGGQMQRVAIARALVNDPDILLADEPTGALDSETSVQIMEILRKIAEKKLIIMVTHNPDLADQYSTRIIRLLDGKVIADSDPYSPEEEAAEVHAPSEADAGKAGKTSMSFGTAVSLSMNNLMTKKGRTFLTAFAGSIGIIGIALILSLSNGINLYIEKVQEDTLSTYPISIQQATVDMSSLMTSLMESREDKLESHEDGRIYSNVMMYDLMDTMMSADVRENNLTDFIEFIESEESGMADYASTIMYGYNVPLHIYSTDTTDGVVLLNPSRMFESMMGGGASSGAGASADSGMSGAGVSGMGSMNSLMSTSAGLSIWQEMIDNEELMAEQYDVLAGHWPTSYDEVVLVVDQNNEINDVFLYALGFKDNEELKDMMSAVMSGENFNAESTSWTYDEILGREFALVLPSDCFKKHEDGTFEFMGENESFMKVKIEEALKLKIAGIVRPNPEAVAASLNGAIGYTSDLTDYILDKTAAADVVKAQLADETLDILTGLKFDDGTTEIPTGAAMAPYIREEIASMSNADRAAIYAKKASSMSDEDAAAQAGQQLAAMPAEMVTEMVRTVMIEQSGMEAAAVDGYMASMSADDLSATALSIVTAQVKAAYAAEIEAQLGTLSTDELAAQLDAMLESLPDEAVAETFAEYMPAWFSDSTYEKNLSLLGYNDKLSPSSVNIYARTFEDKDMISEIIAEYNRQCTADGREEDIINYTDYVALMMSSISTIINVISYVLIAFVSISLVVSSIMIGIITYISVLERTKEIGILRAIGASKKDISRVFNAETLLVGLTSGTIGIVVTLLLCIPANLIIKHLTDISNLAQLPWVGGVALILISMTLTLIAGLIPAGFAAKKDPVEALRSE
ncbi:MAG: ABC transporter ATP-binding protein/permease [Clostridia bacterium]|nr:ABC transporter ATP-binding protein/permease [Clostridia bacterium]